MKKDKYSDAYEQIVENESKQGGFLINDVPLTPKHHFITEQDFNQPPPAPAPDMGGEAPSPEMGGQEDQGFQQGGQEGQDFQQGPNEDWEAVKGSPELEEFLQKGLKEIYAELEDPGSQNDFVKNAIGPALKSKFLKGAVNSNIPYKEIHGILKGGEEMAPEGGEEMAPEGGEELPPEGGEELPPAGGEELPPEGGAQPGDMGLGGDGMMRR